MSSAIISLLSAHMLQHVLIGDVAPALLLLAVRGPLLFFVIPPQLLRAARPTRGCPPRGRLVLEAEGRADGLGARLRRLARARRLRLRGPQPDRARPRARELRRRGPARLEPADRPGAPRRLSRGQRLRVAAVLFLIGTVISDTLIFSFRPLYPAYADQVERVFSLTPLRDQQLAGLVMTVDQILTLGTCAAFLLWPLLRDRRRATAPFARRSSRRDRLALRVRLRAVVPRAGAPSSRSCTCATSVARRAGERPSTGRDGCSGSAWG